VDLGSDFAWPGVQGELERLALVDAVRVMAAVVMDVEHERHAGALGHGQGLAQSKHPVIVFQDQP
jgi:hypothetical protein